MTTISDLFFGNISPPDTLNANSNAQYTRLMKEHMKLTRSLSEQLSPEMMELHNQVCNVQGQMEAILSELYYEQGFRDGAGIMIDVVRGKEGDCND